MPVMRSIMKLAIGYAVTRALARNGGPAGLLGAVLSSVSKATGGDSRVRRGSDRTFRQKQGDARRRH